MELALRTIGITCPPLPGHLNPMLAIGAALRRRGHRVIVLNVADLEDRARAAGLEFQALGERDFPLGSLPAWQLELQKRSGYASISLTLELLTRMTEIGFRDLPPIVRALGIDGLLVDQVEYAGSTVAELQHIPFVTLVNGFPLNREPRIPSVYTAWRPDSSWLVRQRDRVICAIHERTHCQVTVGRLVNQRRKALGLASYRRERDWHSPLAQISQCPEAFDYPRYDLPDVWHGVGPIRTSGEETTPFPFERLDGRPLVYASLGSLQGGKRGIFAAIAAACAPLDVQLVITHAQSLGPQECTGFAGDPVVVPYAPQVALLARSSLVITHAGMNTVLDALTARMPMVTIPITFEQPAIAARVVWHGVGERVPLGQLSAAKLRAAAVRVLGDPRYRLAADRLGRAIEAAGGLTRAVHVIERAFSTGQPVRAARNGPSECELECQAVADSVI